MANGIELFSIVSIQPLSLEMFASNIVPTVTFHSYCSIFLEIIKYREVKI